MCGKRTTRKERLLKDDTPADRIADHNLTDDDFVEAFICLNCE